MSDITNTHLEAAIIDQVVAGQFSGARYAFVAIVNEDGYSLGVAVEDEHGYSPISGKRFPDYAEAKQWAKGLNDHIGLSDDEAAHIIITSMRRH